MDYRAVCLDVCELAREAGAYIARQRERFTFSDVEFKGAQNLVSYVDKQTERTLVERLKALVPEAEFVTEEGTVSAAGGASRLKWIVDPLDGTTNFVHGLSPYCGRAGRRSRIRGDPRRDVLCLARLVCLSER